MATEVAKLLKGTFVLLLLISMSCRPEETTTPKDEAHLLPPKTYGGFNTFGCLINGNLLPDEEMPEKLFSKYYYESYGSLLLHMMADRTSISWGIDEHFYFRLDNIRKPGRYVFYFDDSEHEVRGLFINWRGDMYRSTDAPNLTDSVILHISHLDTAQNIIAGYFEDFSMKNETGQKKIKVTQCRFDIKFN